VKNPKNYTNSEADQWEKYEFLRQAHGGGTSKEDYIHLARVFFRRYHLLKEKTDRTYEHILAILGEKYISNPFNETLYESLEIENIPKGKPE